MLNPLATATVVVFALALLVALAPLLMGRSWSRRLASWLAVGFLLAVGMAGFGSAMGQDRIIAIALGCYAVVLFVAVVLNRAATGSSTDLATPDARYPPNSASASRLAKLGDRQAGAGHGGGARN